MLGSTEHDILVVGTQRSDVFVIKASRAPAAPRPGAASSAAAGEGEKPQRSVVSAQRRLPFSPSLGPPSAPAAAASRDALLSLPGLAIWLDVENEGSLDADGDHLQMWRNLAPGATQQRAFRHEGWLGRWGRGDCLILAPPSVPHTSGRWQYWRPRGAVPRAGAAALTRGSGGSAGRGPVVWECGGPGEASLGPLRVAGERPCASGAANCVRVCGHDLRPCSVPAGGSVRPLRCVFVSRPHRPSIDLVFAAFLLLQRLLPPRSVRGSPLCHSHAADRLRSVFRSLYPARTSSSLGRRAPSTGTEGARTSTTSSLSEGTTRTRPRSRRR